MWMLKAGDGMARPASTDVCGWGAVQGVPCPHGLVASNDMPAVIQRSELILMVVPTPFVARTIGDQAAHFRPKQVWSHANEHLPFFFPFPHSRPIKANQNRLVPCLLTALCLHRRSLWNMCHRSD